MTRHGITKVAAAKLILPAQNIDGADVTKRRKKSIEKDRGDRQV